MSYCSGQLEIALLTSTPIRIPNCEAHRLSSETCHLSTTSTGKISHILTNLASTLVDVCIIGTSGKRSRDFVSDGQTVIFFFTGSNADTWRTAAVFSAAYFARVVVRAQRCRWRAIIDSESSGSRSTTPHWEIPPSEAISVSQCPFDPTNATALYFTERKAQ